MNRRYGNKLCTVFGVEVLEIREMLEVVCVELAAVYNVVRLNVVGEAAIVIFSPFIAL